MLKALFLFVFSLSAFAEKPTITKVAGEVPTATWSNGNQAELRFVRSEHISVPVPMKVVENFCTDGIGQKVVLNVAIRIDLLAWRWSKHTDAEKVGRFVFFKVGEQRLPAAEFQFVTNTLVHKHPNMRNTLPNHDTVEFKKGFAWLGEIAADPKTFTIPTWTGELMIFNSETQTVENRVSGMATNVRLEWESNLTYVMKSYDNLVVATGEEFALTGDIVGWYLPQESRFCQIAFNPNLSEANSKVSELIGKAFSLPFVDKYVWEQDDLTKLVGDQVMLYISGDGDYE